MPARRPSRANTAKQRAGLKTGLVYLRPAHLIAFRAKGPYSSSAAAAWKQMFDWLSRRGLRGKVHRGYGMALDDPRRVPPAECRYDACIEVPEAMPAGELEMLLPQRLPGGPYVRLRCVGPHSELGATAKKLREQWSGQHGMHICPRRPMLEIYLDDPAFCDPARLRTDLCLPIALSSSRHTA